LNYCVVTILKCGLFLILGLTAEWKRMLGQKAR
jgi:hypothetical protein